MNGKMRDGLIQRPSGKWAYVVRAEVSETGLTRPRWHGGFNTMEEAKRARDEARVAIQRGQYRDRSMVTVGEYLAEWVEGRKRAIKPATVASYEQTARQYIGPRIGRLKMQTLAPSQIRAFYSNLAQSGGRKGRPLSDSTVRRTHALLAEAFDTAVGDGLIHRNPARGIKLPKQSVQVDAISLWDETQLAAFLDAVSAHRLAAAFRFIAYTGCRRGEALALRWVDVNLDAGEVTISRTAKRISGQMVTGSTKSGLSRVVALDVGTTAALRAWAVEQKREQLRAGPLWEPSGLVFPRETGAMLCDSTLGQVMRKAMERVALPRIRLHDLRHIHATTLLRAGIPVHTVAQRLGHSTPVITLRTYAHVLPGDSRMCADVFAKCVPATP